MEDFRYILSNPDEYWPVLVMLGLFVAFVAVLSFSALMALLGATKQTRSRRWLILALVPTLFGFLGLLGHARFVGPDYRGFDLKWIFFVPAMLGVLALTRWFRQSNRVSGQA